MNGTHVYIAKYELQSMSCKVWLAKHELDLCFDHKHYQKSNKNNFPNLGSAYKVTIKVYVCILLIV